MIEISDGRTFGPRRGPGANGMPVPLPGSELIVIALQRLGPIDAFIDRERLQTNMR
jgi:hypothetical protein